MWPNRFPQSSKTSGVSNKQKSLLRTLLLQHDWVLHTLKTDLHCPRVADQIAGQLQHLEVYDVRCFLRRGTGLLIRAAKGPQCKEAWSRRQKGKKDHIFKKKNTSEAGKLSVICVNQKRPFVPCFRFLFHPWVKHPSLKPLTTSVLMIFRILFLFQRQKKFWVTHFRGEWKLIFHYCVLIQITVTWSNH